MSIKHFFKKLFKKYRKHRHYHGDNIGIIVTEKSINGQIEGYNRLRDNILYVNTDGNTNVIQIESAVSHEGKTTIACNLAVSLGYAKKRCVVVDLDFRKPKVNRIFGLTNDNGIAEYILGSATEQEVIKHTSYENVDIVSRGAKIYNSTVVLLSDKFKDFIKKLKDEYDYVILDCAPVMLVSDHIHISAVSDGVLFVVAYAMTTKTQVADAVQTLKRNNAKILGTVFSMYDKNKDKSYRHYYYGKGYYKYGYYNYYYTHFDPEDENDNSESEKETKEVQK